MIDKISAVAAKRVPAHALAAFRILFGMILVWEFCRYFYFGRVDRYYLAPSVTFPFRYFEWLPQLPQPIIYGLFITLIVCSLLILVGWFYRPAAIILSLGYAYSFLVDTTNYQNHLYLFCLLLCLLCFLDTHAAWSVDARRRKHGDGSVPAWQPFILKFQIGVVYLYGAIEKLHPEWLSGRSAEAILPFGKSEILDICVGILGRQGTILAFTYVGLIFDFAIVPLLLFRRSRAVGVASALLFNLVCSQVFSIGVFPWFMMAATILFIDPAKLNRLAGRLSVASAMPGPVRPARALPVALVAVYCLFQLVFPFRHFVFEGSYLWNAKGRYFSWTMMQCARDGDIRFYFVDLKDGAKYPVDATRYLTGRQIMKMAFNPQSILRFSVFLQEQARKLDLEEYSLHAVSKLSLNNKPPVPYVREEVDLSKVSLGTDVDDILHPPPPGYLVSGAW